MYRLYLGRALQCETEVSDLRKIRNLILFISLLVVVLTSSGCSGKKNLTTELLETDFSNNTIRLAQQYGMHYAPAYVMQELGILDELLPGVKLEWSNFGGGSAMNEALISNQLDVAFMGIPPVLIAIDKGVDYRIASGISVPPAELIVRPTIGVQKVSDIKSEHKIAVPGIGSIQHIMLSKVAQDVLGNANALDMNLVAMANPDAYSSLISGTEVVGHFASMPYIDLEIKDGMKSILTAADVGGGASIVCVTTKAFTENLPLYEALLEGLSKTIELINDQDEEALRVISETEKITIEQAKIYATWPGTIYSTDLYRLNELGEFMAEVGFLTSAYKGFEHVTWPGAIEATAY
jgi:NitT/TauT family transport system substrate-binding protein